MAVWQFVTFRRRPALVAGGPLVAGGRSYLPGDGREREREAIATAMDSATKQHCGGHVRVLEVASVSPAPDVSVGGGGSPASIPLTFFDIIWVAAGTVERLFFYELPEEQSSVEHFVEHLVPRLKTSLAVALRRFYPLAGHARATPGSDNELFELYYAEGADSVPFTVAVSDADFDELAGAKPRAVTELQSLVAPLKSPGGPGFSTVSLLALQATLFPGRGVCIGVTVHHAACDGSGSVSFIRSWAAAFRSHDADMETPFFDRSVIVDPSGFYELRVGELKGISAHVEANPKISFQPHGDLVLASFTLSETHIEKLKQAIAGAGAGELPFRCSTFVAACAYAWACHVKSQRSPAPATAHFGFVVDCRRRLSPPVPAAYFGNCLGNCFAEVKVEAMAAAGGGGGGEDVGRAVFAGAAAIGGLIAGLDSGGVLKGAEELVPRIFRIVKEGARVLSVAGSPRFRVYGVDFGWGKPAKVEVVSISRTGAMSLAESGGGGGGVEIGLALPPSEMEVFSAHFYGGLDALSS